MALKNQLNFASGEIDPILHDRVTLERFQNGLETARNVMISKKGTMLSRFARSQFAEVTHDGPIKIFSPPDTEDLVEFGVNSTNDKFYIKYYRFDYLLTGSIIDVYEEATAGDMEITADNLENLQFTVDQTNIYIFTGSENPSKIHRLRYGISPSFTPNVVFDIPPAPLSTTITEVGSPSGYVVDYAVTYVRLGEESKPQISITTTINKPIGTSQRNEFEFILSNSTTLFSEYSEVRVYRRPHEGSAFGLVGVSSEIFIDGSDIKATFTDIGADADFSNGLQSLASLEGLSSAPYITDLKIGTGTIYQGRFVLGNFESNSEAIIASRPGFKTNFYRDFPYDSDSALLFKAGSEGYPKILRMIDADGLVVFTSRGVFVSLGLLSPSNIYLDKRGNWVIDESIPPLLIPGALLFVDKTTNSIRQLVYSQELGGYDSIDQSVFSEHLFKNKTIKSWAFQEGITPLLIITFSDGTFATFTYSYEHQMRAWTRHDSKFPVEQVAGTTTADTSFFVVNKNGTRSIERTIPRYVTGYDFENNADIDKFENNALMDSLKVKSGLLESGLTGDFFTITPVTPGDWSGQLTITSSVFNWFDPETFPELGGGLGNTGEVYRIFKTSDKSKIDLEYVSTVDGFSIIVQPSDEYPSTQSVAPRLYLTHTTIDGLDYMEGESVSVMVDGDVIASPNNDSEGVSTYEIIVTGGSITLPEGFRSAITIVGRPVVCDIQTLNISTVEQSPTMIESLTVNKLYLRVFESRGLFVSNIFPEEKVGGKDGNSVSKMDKLTKYYQQSGVPITGNRPMPTISRRIEVTTPGSWDTQGKISMRQVDPVHFEILSIIADVNIERRSDR